MTRALRHQNRYPNNPASHLAPRSQRRRLYCSLPLTVLYLDDSPDDHLLLQHVARRLGTVSLVSLQQPQAVMDYLQETHERFAPVLLLLDYDLGTCTTLELLQRLRRCRRWSELPVVIYSGGDDAETINACYAAGADAFLCKPADLNRMRAILQMLGEALRSQSLERLRRLSEYRGDRA